MTLLWERMNTTITGMKINFITLKCEAMNNRHTCNTEVKVKQRKGKIFLDQFEFAYIEGEYEIKCIPSLYFLY